MDIGDRCVNWPSQNESPVIVAIGDPHIHTKDVEATTLMLQEIVEISKQVRPDAIVVLGDVYHTFERLNVGAETRGNLFLSALNDIAPLVVLVGNHDLRNNKTMFESEDQAVHPFIALRKWPNTLVCDVPKLFKVGTCTFCGVPYLPVGSYHDAVKGIDSTGITAFFSHQEFRGVRTKVGIEKSASQVGDVWSPDHRLNISGHYHDAQIVQPNLIYVGTSRQIHWGESEDKAVGVFSFGPTILPYPVVLENPEPNEFRYYRIRMTTIPYKLEYVHDASDILVINQKISELINLIQGGSINLFKLKIRGTREEIEYVKTFPLIRQVKSEYPEKIVCDYETVDVKSQVIVPELEQFSGTTKCFDDILFELIRQDEGVRLCYEEIFRKKIH